MDKYEYQARADQIKLLIKERHFSEAMDIADTIDWRRVKSFSMLCTVSEIYKVNKHYSEARDILLLAYERYPDRANVVYALCELAIKLDDISESVEYYKEYVRLKPHDSNRYVLLYKIYEAQEVPLEEKISLLEEFKRVEYTEKWAYELASLYHKDGQETKCVETCDELVLWFGEGPYVRKALDLKMQHAPLTKEQQRKYDGVYDAPVISKNEGEEQQVHIYETQSMNAYANGASPFETAPINNAPVNVASEAVPQQNPQNTMQQQMQPEQQPQPQQQMGYQGYVDPHVAMQAAEYQDINVQPLNTDKYSTLNLQEELAKNMEEFYSRERDDVAAPYYGSTAQLYEPSQQQFLDQINQAGPVAQQPIMQSQPVVEEQPIVQQPVAEPQPVVQQQPIVEPQPVVQQQPIVEPQPVVEEQPVVQQHEEPAAPQQQIVLPVYEESVVARTGNIGPIQIEAPQAGMVRVPKQYEDKLREGSDGQVTMALPDAKEIEKQITGQIDISDFMKDWEAKKRDGEDKRRAQIKAKGLEQTNDIMAQLVGVIPGIEKGVEAVTAASTPIEPSIDMIPQPQMPMTPVNEVLQDDKKGVVIKTTMSSPTFDRDSNVKRTESGAIINGPMVSSVTGDIPDILPNADIMEKGDILPSGHRLTLDEQYGGNIAKIRQEDAELVKRMTGELPPEEELVTEPVEEQPVDYGEAEEIEEIEQPDVELEEDDKKEEDPRPVTGSIPPLNIPELEEAIVNTVESIQEPISYPYEIEDDLGEVEELIDLEQPDDVDDILKTRPLPVDQLEESEQLYENSEDADEETEVEAEEEDNTPAKRSIPPHMMAKEKPVSRRDFEDIERALFGRYEGIEALKAQIVDVVDYMSMEPRHGNVVVIGSENFGRKDIAINIVKATQAFDKKFQGKVAKISGEALNKKNIPVTLGKLKNGALIVENAGGLTPITVNSITEALLASEEPIMVVFEGEKDTIEPLLNGCKETRTVFDARIVINDFTDDDLVAFAKGYAREQEYSIDEMGTLALHTKIADMQTYDHAVSIQEVMDIVDDAIRHVDRKNMSHFMDVLVGKRYDDEDFIVLREKDFML